MTVRRVGGLAAMALPILVWMACGQVYRPVVIPCSTGGVPGCPVESNPAPSNFHAVFGISINAPTYPGGAMQIDVSGDSVIGETPTYDPSKPNLGDNPTHAAIPPNSSRIFVASAGSVGLGGVDVVSSFTPAFQSTIATGLGAVNTIALPAGSQPVFVNTTQNTALYVANFGTNSVSAINTSSNVLSNTVPVGLSPVSLAETPNAFKLYVANQGSNSVSSLNPTDLSQNVVTGFTGVTPVWVVARKDSQKVYVLTQGDGQLVTIDVATDTVTNSLPVGVGANYIFYDPNLNRIYVTNPLTASLYIFSASGGPNDTPLLLAPSPLTIPGLDANTTPACATCGAVFPVSVTALADGSRFYVASYQCQGACATTTGVVPIVSVYDANSLTLKYPSTPKSPGMPTLTLLGFAPFAAGQFAVPPVAACATAPLYPALYSPTSTRFRVFTSAAADSSRVYVSMCDAGVVAVINTTDGNTNNSGSTVSPDTVITDLLTAPEANSASALQSPIFLLMGQ